MITCQTTTSSKYQSLTNWPEVCVTGQNDNASPVIALLKFLLLLKSGSIDNEKSRFCR